MEDQQSTKKKRVIHQDRIVLEEQTLVLMAQIQTQIDKAFGGLIKLSNKEVANFVLQVRFNLLNQAELELIREKYFDDVRAAKWALQKLKNAKSGGEKLSLLDVVEMLQTPFAKKTRAPRMAKAKRKDSASVPTSNESHAALEARVKGSNEP